MAVERRKATLRFLVVFVLVLNSCRPVESIQEYLGSCGYTIDLLLTQNIQSAILTMPMPESMDKYQDPARPINCDINIYFTSGMNLLLEVYFLDIMPLSSDITTCTTGLEIFDQTGRSYYGGRICMEAWQWEERHREKQQEKVVVENSPVTFRLVSEGPYRGQGFKLHFGQFRPNWPCNLREFKCQQITRCVHDDLTCDGWDDCGDFSDERYEAGCELLTASEICSLIMGVVLLIGTVAQIVIFCFTYRRLRQEYGMRSESKVPIADEKYNMEPVLGVGRRYNSQESIPSRYSRSTAATMAKRDSDSDTIDKVDLEKSDRQELLTGYRAFNKAGDNMSERSYRSNPRKTTAQSLGSVAPSDSVKKSGQYSYSGRKGRSSSQSSLTRDKTDPEQIHDTSADRDSLHKERFDSRERLSDKNRRYNRKDDFDSDSNEYDDRDRYDDRKRRSSRERERRRTDRYSDEDSDYDRDRRRRRRRRRSYDSYSDDSDYVYERERDRRRSRERYSDDRYDDEDESDRAPGKDRGGDKQSSRKGSRERNHDRDRYSHEKYDDDTDRDQGKDIDKDRDKHRGHSRERDRDRYRDSYDEDRAYRKHVDDDDDDDDDDYDRSGRRRRNVEKRRGPSAEKDRLSADLSRNENKRSRSREILAPMETALPMPPPYTEQDPRENPTALKGSKNANREDHHLPLPPADLSRATDNDSSQRLTNTHRNKGNSGHRASPAVDGANQQSPSSDHAKLADQHKHREAAKPPASKLDLRHNERPPPKEMTEADLRHNERPPPKEMTEADRRKSNDDRRERYSHSRWAPKNKRQDSPPPEYEDVAPKSTFVGISYREESV